MWREGNQDTLFMGMVTGAIMESSLDITQKLKLSVPRLFGGRFSMLQSSNPARALPSTSATPYVEHDPNHTVICDSWHHRKFLVSSATKHFSITTKCMKPTPFPEPLPNLRIKIPLKAS